MRASYFVQGMRRRDSTQKIKVQHSIIAGLQKKLQNLLLSPSGDSIREHHSGDDSTYDQYWKKKDVYFRITVPASNNGWKALAFSDGARQELFISTSTPIERQSMHDALVQCGLAPLEGNSSSPREPSRKTSLKSGTRISI